MKQLQAFSPSFSRQSLPLAAAPWMMFHVEHFMETRQVRTMRSVKPYSRTDAAGGPGVTSKRLCFMFRWCAETTACAAPQLLLSNASPASLSVCSAAARRRRHESSTGDCPTASCLILKPNGAGVLSQRSRTGMLHRTSLWASIRSANDGRCPHADLLRKPTRTPAPCQLPPRGERA